MKFYDLLIKLNEYVQEKKTLVDLSAGGTVGVVTSIGMYWDHLTDPATLEHFADGVIGTSINTITGAVILYLVHNYILKNKKQDNKKS